MKKIKSIIALLSACTLIASFTTSAIAETSLSSQENTSAVNEYIESCIPRFFAAQSINGYPTVSYTEPIPLLDYNNFTELGYETFISSNDVLIGKMDIYTANGFTAMFDTNITDEMQNAYDNSSDISIGYYDDSLLLYTEDDGYTFVDGLYTGYPVQTPSISAINDVNAHVCGYVTARVPLANKTLNISHVPNSTTYHSSGECWAACVAMVLNYKQGCSLDADTVYNQMTILGKSHHSPSAYDYYGYSYTIQDEVTPDCGAMSANTVWAQINSDRPVSITVKKAGSTTSHQVVIYGILLQSENTIYTIDNPNSTKAQSFTITGNPLTVTETISYGSYTKWCQSIY